MSKGFPDSSFAHFCQGHRPILQCTLRAGFKNICHLQIRKYLLEKLAKKPCDNCQQIQMHSTLIGCSKELQIAGKNLLG